MKNVLPPLHEGHAPFTLLQLFREAVDAFEEWAGELTEPIVTFEGRIIPISAVFEALRGCTDIMPSNLLGAITERLTKPWEGEGPQDAMTFSTASRIMGVLVRKRLFAADVVDAAIVKNQAEEHPER
jgi:hypothetical protein